MECQNATTATIEILDNGTILERIFSRNPPITATYQRTSSLKEGQCPTRYNVIIRTTDYCDRDKCSGTPNIKTHIVENVLGPIKGTKTKVEQFVSGAGGLYQLAGFSLEHAQTTTNFYSCRTPCLPTNDVEFKADIIQIIRLDGLPDDCGDTNKSECELTISDRTGVIYKITRSDCAQYTVACDDNCPPNHLKCKTLNYPGYYCIPCSGIKSEIQSLTNMLRGMNNG